MRITWFLFGRARYSWDLRPIINHSNITAILSEKLEYSNTEKTNKPLNRCSIITYSVWTSFKEAHQRNAVFSFTYFANKVCKGTYYLGSAFIIKPNKRSEQLLQYVPSFLQITASMVLTVKSSQCAITRLQPLPLPLIKVSTVTDYGKVTLLPKQCGKCPRIPWLKISLALV